MGWFWFGNCWVYISLSKVCGGIMIFGETFTLAFTVIMCAIGLYVHDTQFVMLAVYSLWAYALITCMKLWCEHDKEISDKMNEHDFEMERLKNEL